MIKDVKPESVQDDDKTLTANTGTRSELNQDELDAVAGGLAPNLSSMMKSLWNSKRSPAAPEGRPMGVAYPSSGCATKA